MKLFWVGAIVGVTVLTILFLTVLMPFISDTAFTAANDTSMASFGSTQAGLRAAPFWIYLIPVVIGVVSIVAVLKAKK